jgi:hypothetical protein
MPNIANTWQIASTDWKDDLRNCESGNSTSNSFSSANMTLTLACDVIPAT